MDYQNEIYGKRLESRVFHDLLEQYSSWISKQHGIYQKTEFKNFVKELLPMKTFLKNTDYSHVFISKKHGKEDINEVDATIWKGDVEKKIQIVLASSNPDDFKQEFFQMKLSHTKEGQTPDVSTYGKIFTSYKDMEQDLLARKPHLKKITSESNISYQKCYGKDAKEYFIEEDYRKFTIGCKQTRKTWYQANNVVSQDEIVNHKFEAIRTSMDTKLKKSTNGTYDILLIGSNDYDLFTDQEPWRNSVEKLSKKLGDLKTIPNNIKVYIVGISKTTFFKEL
jgi:hypothetical protein